MSTATSSEEQNYADNTPIDKVSRVLEFIRESIKLKRPKTLHIKDVDQTVWINNFLKEELPGVSVGDGRQRWVLRVENPPLPNCPKPPELLVAWLLDTHYEDPAWNPEKGLRKTLQMEVEIPGVGDEEPRREVQLIQFEDDAARSEALTKWMAERSKWLEEMARLRRTRFLYLTLFEMRRELENSNLKKEIVLGNFFFESRSAEGLPAPAKYPLLTRRLKVETGSDARGWSFLSLEPDDEAGAVFNDVLLSQFADMGLNLSAKEYIPGEVIDAGGELNTGDAYAGKFKSFAEELHPRAKWMGKTESSDFPPDTDFIVYERPVLMLRDRLLGLDESVERIRLGLEADGGVPRHLRIVICDEDAPAPRAEADEETHEQRLAATAGEDEDILLAKAANKEQLEIARRVRERGSVVVQGPPGTGKTHTIANLIGHFLSEGKRILVASQTTKALSVLKEKLPADFHDLCVSRVSENQKEILDTVGRFSDRIERLNRREMNRTIEQTTSERREVLEQLCKTRSAIFDQLNREIGTIVFNGQSLKLTEAAERLHKGEARLALIPGRMSEKAAFPLEEEEYRLLTEWRAAQSQEDLREVAAALPQASSLMKPDMFERAAAELERIESGRRPDVILDVETNVDLYGNSTTIFHTNDDLPDFTYPTDKGAEISAAWDKAKDELDVFKDGGALPMVGYALADSFGRCPDEASFRELLSRMEKALATEREVRKTEINYEVKDPEGCLVSEQWIEGFRRLKTEAPDGKPGLFWKLCNGSLLKSIARVTVNDKPAQSAAAMDAIERHIAMHDARKAFNQFWGRLNMRAPQPGPSADAIGDSMESIDEVYREPLERALKVKRDVVDPLLSAWRSAGMDLQALGAPRSGQNGLAAVETMRSRFLPTVLAAMQIIGAQIRHAEISGLLAKQRELLEAFEDTRTTARLRQALCERSPDYRGAYEELRRLNELEPEFERWRGAWEKLDAEAPELAARFSLKEEVSLAESPAYVDLVEGWRLRRLEKVYRAAMSCDLRSLQKKASELSLKYRRLTTKLAADKAWMHAQDRRESKPTMIAALKRAAQEMKRYGKGTGKYAAQHLRYARQGLQEGSAVVPAWIMTIDQAITSFDSSPKGTAKYYLPRSKAS